MKTKKLYFMECNVAGRQYHDADEVWKELKVGTRLRLVRDMDNRYDPQAVAIVYDKPIDDADLDRNALYLDARCVDDQVDEYVLGYVPRTDNKGIAALLEMGWNNVFECRISKIDEEEHYNEQIRVTIRIVKNEA